MTVRLLATVRALLVALLLLAAPGAAWAAEAGDGAELPEADHAVVVGVPGLRWADVTAGVTPNLFRLVGEGSVGLLSVKAIPPTTCAADGWITLSAGGRAAAMGRVDGRGCPPTVPYLTPVAGAAGGTVQPELPDIRRANEGTDQRSRPGSLGDGVRCAAALGDGATLAAADADGDVGVYRATVPAGVGSAEELAAVLRACPVTVVAANQLEADRPVRSQALAAVDRTVGAVAEALPPGGVLVVAGISETGLERWSLHPLVAVGDGVPVGTLSSGSTGRSPYVQLIDLAPSVLQVTVGDIGSFAGKPVRASAAADPDEPAAVVARMAQLSERAILQQRFMGAFDGAWAVLGLLSAAVILLLRRRPGTPRALVVVAASFGALPVASLLANGLPWWRAGAPGAALAALVAVWVGILAALALGGPWRRARLGPTTFLAAVTVGVIAVDMLLGAPLQMDGLIGYSPLVAGRFTGMSNLTFGAYAVAAVVVLAVAAYGRTKPVASAILVVGGVALTWVVGSPSAGNDFGGTLAVVPAFVVLFAMLVAHRLTLVRVGLAMVVAVVVVLVFSFLDHQRPEDQRSHFGWFFDSLVNGGAWEVVSRKIDTQVMVLFATPVTFAVPFLLLGLTVLLVRPRGSVVVALVARLHETPPLYEAMVAASLAGLIGMLLNDSGIALAAVAMGTAVPFALLGATWLRAWPTEATRGADAPEGRADRVPEPVG